MGLISSLFRSDASGGHGPTDDYWYGPVNAASLTGIRVGAKQALSSGPVFAATRVLADSVASLPLFVYERRLDGGKDKVPWMLLYSLLHDQPNELQTTATWLRVTMVHALLWQNAYTLIEPGVLSNGQYTSVGRLTPLHPDGVKMEQLPNGTWRYQVWQRDGTWKPYQLEQIMHIRGLSLDGMNGLSLMDLARETIGVNLAAREYSARFFGQGGRPSGVLKHPGKLSKGGRENLRETWTQTHGGLAGMQKVAILEEGMEWQSTGLTSTDAQLIELLDWSTEDTARYFNVPLHMLQSTSKVTSWGTGIAEMSLGFVTYSLLPWLVNIQQEIKRCLIEQKDRFFAEFNVDAMLRGNTLARYQAHQIAAGGQAPWMTRNEIRSIESLNPLPGLDEILTPNKMSPGQQPGTYAQDGTREYLTLMLRDAAARVVRKEIGALSRIVGDEQLPYSGSVVAKARSFYAEHQEYVERVLKLPSDVAAEYCQHQTELIEAGGLDALIANEEQQVGILTSRALEVQTQ